MTHYDAIFILGPQGSGKGTQQKILAGKLGYYIWDTGKTLRENRDARTVTGETVGEIIDRGQLLTDEQLLGVVKPFIAAIPADQGITFDGIPRRLGQAEFIVDFLRSRGRDKMATLVIEVPHEESLKRLLLRAEKEKREDDTKEAIEYRLQQYHDETVPMLSFLEKNSDLYRIDGVGTIEEIAERIDKALGISGI